MISVGVNARRHLDADVAQPARADHDRASAEPPHGVPALTAWIAVSPSAAAMSFG